MRLFADENIDASIVDRLRSDGHDVPSVAEMSPSITDEEVLENANAGQYILLTGDKDFGELVFRLRRVAYGVIFVRLPGISSTLKGQIVSEAIRDHGHEMIGAFTVISAGMIRIRCWHEPTE